MIAFWIVGFLFTFGFTQWESTSRRSAFDKVLTGIVLVGLTFCCWPLILGSEVRKVLK